MRHVVLLTAAAAVATLLATSAGATTTIDFDNTGGLFTPTYSEAGVTFVPNGGNGLQFTFTPSGSNGFFAAGSPHPTITATIAGGASSVGVDLGDFQDDADLLFLEAYNAANVLLGRTELLIDGSFHGMKTLSLSFSGIDHVTFGSAPPSGDGASIYVDNFTFDAPTVSATPEPAAWIVMLAGFFGLGAKLRRERAATA
jgi:hypothetical protein